MKSVTIKWCPATIALNINWCTVVQLFAPSAFIVAVKWVLLPPDFHITELHLWCLRVDGTCYLNFTLYNTQSFVPKRRGGGVVTKQDGQACKSQTVCILFPFIINWGCMITHSTKFLETNTKFTYLWFVCCCITVTPANCHFRIFILSKHKWSGMD